MKNEENKCGFVTIIGRPNVGKSTLLNKILGKKLSITSRKPQTTRHRIVGVKTMGPLQVVYVDTPGLHLAEKHAINRQMNKAARYALQDVDAVVFVVDSLRWTEEDEWVLELLGNVKCPIILAINKVDTVDEKEALLPHLEALAKKANFAEIILISAQRGTNVEVLERKINTLMPEGPHHFPEDQITNRSPRFRVAEIIREKIIRLLGQELPYATTVEIESYTKEGEMQMIAALIWVERAGQKPIVIGKNGERLKEIGTRARKDIENFLGRRVHLKLWVKVKENWSDDERALSSWGYMDSE